MFKVVMPIKRKIGVSKAEFEEYYENNHRMIGEKYLRGYAHKYTRRYLHNLDDGSGVEQDDPEYDVLLEAWYPDEATFRAFLKSISTPEITSEIITDEEKFMDRTNMRMYFIKESVSDF